MKVSRSLIVNMGYVLSANLSSLFISILITLFVPRIIGVAEYGLWELYIFYGSYIGLLHFGWADGLILRYAGKEFSTLDPSVFRPAGALFAAGQLVLMLLLVLWCLIFRFNNLYILISVAILMALMNLRVYNTFLLQATNRMKNFSSVIFLGNIIFLVGLGIVFMMGLTYERLIIVDLFSKFISLLYSYYLTSNLHGKFKEKTEWTIVWLEVKTNIFAGVPLTVAYLIGLLITGVYRFAIEWKWGIEDFAQISLALNISSVVLIFVSAIGVAAFPVLKKLPEEMYSSIYHNVNYWMTFLLFLISAFFYIGRPILLMWLPQYEEGISYLTFLFPIFIFQSKNALLNATFLKAIRQEKVIVKQNLLTVGLSSVLAFMSTVIFTNIQLVIISVLISNIFVCIMGELLLNKIFKSKNYSLIFQQLIASASFILIAMYVHHYIAPIVFSIALVLVFRPKISQLKLLSVK